MSYAYGFKLYKTSYIRDLLDLWYKNRGRSLRYDSLRDRLRIVEKLPLPRGMWIWNVDEVNTMLTESCIN